MEIGCNMFLLYFPMNKIFILDEALEFLLCVLFKSSNILHTLICMQIEGRGRKPHFSLFSATLTRCVVTLKPARSLNIFTWTQHHWNTLYEILHASMYKLSMNTSRHAFLCVNIQYASGWGMNGAYVNVTSINGLMALFQLCMRRQFREKTKNMYNV